jgi:hypothetical protein
MKIALLEKENNSIDVSKFDRIISFCRDNHTNVDKFISSAEIELIYDQVYSGLYSWIGYHSANKSFFYSGVDVLQAYGKILFDFLFNLCQKVWVVKKIIQEEAPQELWILSNSIKSDSKYPSLNLFISEFLPLQVSLRSLPFPRQEVSRIMRIQSGHPFLLKYSLDLLRRLLNLSGIRKDNSILVYSDLHKIFGLLKYLKNESVIYLTDDLPERFIFYQLSRPVILSLFSDFKISRSQNRYISEKAATFIENLNDLPEKLTVDRMDFTSYVKKYLVTVWQKDLAGALKRINQMDTLFQRFKIKSSLVDEDRTVYKNLLVQVSRKYKCNSYVNCHGEPFHKIGFMPLTADYMMVWGRKQKEILNEWGLDEKKVIITGCSKYDKYLPLSADSIKAKICKNLKFSLTRPLVVIAPFPLKKGRNMLENSIWSDIRQVIATVSQFGELQIIIKLHPGDDNEPYIRSLVKDLNSNVIKIITKYDPLKLAKGADLLIVYRSTFAIDGLAYQKPVILADSYSMQRYKDLKVFYSGTKVSELVTSINGILNNTYKDHIVNWKSAIDYCLGGMDGAVSKRIAEILSKDG